MSEKKNKKRRKIGKLIAAGVAVVVTVAFALIEAFVPFSYLLPPLSLPLREEGEIRLHFLDVGQGDCTIVEFSEGDLLVIDGGKGEFRAGNRLLRYIKGLHPASLSIMATHTDSDHYGGLVRVLHTFKVETCYLPLVESGGASYLSFLETVEEEGCVCETLTRGSVIEREGAKITCLSPYEGEETEGDDASTVLYLDLHGVTALLCGDISAAREKLLLEEDLPGTGEPLLPGKIDLLKAAHHGSGSSSSEEWLRFFSPSVLVVSCGQGNLYGHPDFGALERFRAASPDGAIYRTDELGDVMVSVKGDGYTVTTGGMQ